MGVALGVGAMLMAATEGAGEDVDESETPTGTAAEEGDAEVTGAGGAGAGLELAVRSTANKSLCDATVLSCSAVTMTEYTYAAAPVEPGAGTGTAAGMATNTEPAEAFTPLARDAKDHSVATMPEEVDAATARYLSVTATVMSGGSPVETHDTGKDPDALLPTAERSTTHESDEVGADTEMEGAAEGGAGAAMEKSAVDAVTVLSEAEVSSNQ